MTCLSLSSRQGLVAVWTAASVLELVGPRVRRCSCETPCRGTGAGVVAVVVGEPVVSRTRTARELAV